MLISPQLIFSQVYAGYVLHTCLLEDVEGVERLDLRDGLKVEARVDYARRRLVAPNHTMTHTLNNALRKVVGDSVDQKGSLVTEDKFRLLSVYLTFSWSCSHDLSAGSTSVPRAV